MSDTRSIDWGTSQDQSHFVREVSHTYWREGDSNLILVTLKRDLSYKKSVSKLRLGGIENDQLFKENGKYEHYKEKDDPSNGEYTESLNL